MPMLKEAHDVGREGWPLLGECVPQAPPAEIRRDLDLENQQGDGNGEDAVAERLHPAGVSHGQTVAAM